MYKRGPDQVIQLHGMPCQNQLQFNLNVPLTAEKLVTYFHKPKPIMIERIGAQGHSAIPGDVKQKSKNKNEMS